MIRAVLDTSVLVPARLREDLQSLAQDGAYTAIWSPWIIAEVNRTLTWHWLARHGVRVTTTEGHRVTTCDISHANWMHCGLMAKRMMEILLTTPNWELVDPHPPYPNAWDAFTDVWDYPIWAAAIGSEAQYVVSNNIHDYPPLNAMGRHIHEGVEYLSGANFISLLTD
jgi:hypothetical protein